MVAMREADTLQRTPTELRGHVDAIGVGRGFIHVQGWVCQHDNAAAMLPVSIVVRGRSFSGYGLSLRTDLELAGIADGQAALDAVLPLEDCEIGLGYEVTLADASGASCTVYCGPENVHAFIPLGHIDQINSRFVLGWVFDPGATDRRHATKLLLNEDEIAEIVPGVERFELHFDRGNGRKTFGFELSAEPIKAAIRQRLYIGSREATLALASSRVVLATVKVRLIDGEITADPPPPSRLKPFRLPASDRLDELLAALG